MALLPFQRSTTQPYALSSLSTSENAASAGIRLSFLMSLSLPAKHASTRTIP